MSGSKLQVAAKSSTTITPVPAGLLQRKCACGNHTVSGSECESCNKNREGLIQHSGIKRTDTSPPKHFQTKLRIGEAGDTYEQEADRTADAVMSMGQVANRRSPFAITHISEANTLTLPGSPKVCIKSKTASKEKPKDK